MTIFENLLIGRNGILRASRMLLLLLVLTSLPVNGRCDEQSPAQRYLYLSENLVQRNLDSALLCAQKAYNSLSTEESARTRTSVLHQLGFVYQSKGDHASALKYFLESKSFVDTKYNASPDDADLIALKAEVRLKIGTLHLYLRNFSKSLAYCDEALSIIEKYGSRIARTERLLLKLKLYNNIAAVHIQLKDYDTALTYFRNALELNEAVKNRQFEGALLNNIGICYLEKHEPDLSGHYFLKALKIRSDLADEAGQAQVLNNLGKSEVFQHRFTTAFDYFKQALELSRKTGSNASEMIALESLSSVSDTLGNYKQALQYYKAYKRLSDRIFNADSQTAIANLEATHKRESDKRKYETRLHQKESESRNAWYRSVLLLLLLCVAVLVILVLRSRIRTSRLRQEKLLLERENLELTRKALEEDLELKERELTAQALFLLQNEELMGRVADSLLMARSSFNRDNQQLITEIVRELKSNRHQNAWEEFETHFTRVHAQFYTALQEKFPGLTANEKKLCAFLRLNLSTKDISAITNQSINSITVARSRLRKKLGIDGEEVHLINFLMEL